MKQEDSRRGITAKQLIRGETQEIDFIDDAYARAVNEWNQIEALPILCISSEDYGPNDDRANLKSISDAIGTTERKEATAVSQSDLECFMAYVRSVDLIEELPNIVCHRKRSVFAKIVRKVLFLGPTAVKHKLKTQRNRIFALALKPFDNGDPVQMRMLTSLYLSLRKEEVSMCPRYGSHWEEIGFQGNDPASDLRGVGILGLFQLVTFVLSQQTAPLAYDIYDLSLKANNDFPFCVMGLNMTQIALHHLREGKLNQEMNRTQDPIMTFNLFYACLFKQLFALWKEKGYTVADTGFLLRDLKQSSGKDVRKSIQAVTSYKSSSEEKQAIASNELVVFSDIGNIVDPDTKDMEEGEENLV